MPYSSRPPTPGIMNLLSASTDLLIWGISHQRGSTRCGLGCQGCLSCSIMASGSIHGAGGVRVGLFFLPEYYSPGRMDRCIYLSVHLLTNNDRKHFIPLYSNALFTGLISVIFF